MSDIILEDNIGVKIGRLSNFKDGKERFPIETWKSELKLIHNLNIKKIDWSISKDSFFQNPIFYNQNTTQLFSLLSKYNLSINSIILDFIIQNPFWRFNGKERDTIENSFYLCIESCFKQNIKKIVFPILENSKLKNKSESVEILLFFKNLESLLKKYNLQILLETDFNPKFYKTFLSNLNFKYFKVCYDTGNSAGNFFDIEEEFNLYGDYIESIHIKDKNKNNNSVTLGEGLCDFVKFSKLIKDYDYKGNFIFESFKKIPLFENLELQIKFFKSKVLEIL